MAFSLTDFPLVFGFVLGLSLAMPPGPILAYAADRGIRGGYWPAVTVGLGATTADATFCGLMALGLVRLIAGNTTVLDVLTLGGSALMLFFAYGAWRTAEASRGNGGAMPTLDESQVKRVAAKGTFVAGFVLAITSPYNFAWWSGVGTGLFQDFGWSVFVGFFAGIVSWVFVFAWLVVWMRSRVKGALMVVSYASAVMLAGFAVWLGWTALSGLVA